MLTVKVVVVVKMLIVKVVKSKNAVKMLIVKVVVKMLSSSKK